MHGFLHGKSSFSAPLCQASLGSLSLVPGEDEQAFFSLPLWVSWLSYILPEPCHCSQALFSLQGLL